MDEIAELPEHMTPSEVAELVGYTHPTVLRWIRSGKLRARRSPGGTYRVPRSEVVLLLAHDEPAA
jgi:putative resolvase